MISTTRVVAWLSRTECGVKCSCMLLPDQRPPHGSDGQGQRRILQVSSPIGLRACYAMSVTGEPYDAIGLHFSYAIPGTGITDDAAGLRA
eukprot:3860322-Rhodomonas_salina.3